jgi:Na+-driven multidrug efflux pump
MDKDIIIHILRKVFSAQWVVTIAIVNTYCLSIILCLYLVIKDKLSIEAFLGIFIAFSTLAATIIQSYFKRERTPPGNGG